MGIDHQYTKPNSVIKVASSKLQKISKEPRKHKLNKY